MRRWFNVHLFTERLMVLQIVFAKSAASASHDYWWPNFPSSPLVFATLKQNVSDLFNPFGCFSVHYCNFFSLINNIFGSDV